MILDTKLAKCSKVKFRGTIQHDFVENERFHDFGGLGMRGEAVLGHRVDDLARGVHLVIESVSSVFLVQRHFG